MLAKSPLSRPPMAQVRERLLPLLPEDLAGPAIPAGAAPLTAPLSRRAGAPTAAAATAVVGGAARRTGSLWASPHIRDQAATLGGATATADPGQYRRDPPSFAATCARCRGDGASQGLLDLTDRQLTTLFEQLPDDSEVAEALVRLHTCAATLRATTLGSAPPRASLKSPSAGPRAWSGSPGGAQLSPAARQRARRAGRCTGTGRRFAASTHAVRAGARFGKSSCERRRGRAAGAGGRGQPPLCSATWAGAGGDSARRWRRTKRHRAAVPAVEARARQQGLSLADVRHSLPHRPDADSARSQRRRPGHGRARCRHAAHRAHRSAGLELSRPLFAGVLQVRGLAREHLGRPRKRSPICGSRMTRSVPCSRPRPTMSRRGER